MGGLAGQPAFSTLEYERRGAERSGGSTRRARKAIADASEWGGVRWWQWRVVADPRVPDGLWEIRNRWRWVDLIEAHWALDAYDVIAEEGRKKKPGRERPMWSGEKRVGTLAELG